MNKIGLKSIKLKYLLGKTNLKRDLLYFDKLVFDENELKMSKSLVGPLGETLFGETNFKEIYKFQLAELDYLLDENLIFSFNSDDLRKIVYQNELKPFKEYYDSKKDNKLLLNTDDILNLGSIMQETDNIIQGKSDNSTTIFKTHFYSEILNATTQFETVPILENFVPEQNSDLGKNYKILEIILNKFPLIDETVSWEKLIDYKKDPDSKRKFLALRNWMIDISKGEYNPSEINEKFDYLFSEYDTHIKKHKIKTNYGLIKTFSISTAEILENLATLKWSKAIKTSFEIFEKNTRLTEIESNAPGKEIGYIYDISEKVLKK